MQNLNPSMGIQKLFDAYRFVKVSFAGYGETEGFVVEIDQHLSDLKSAEGNYQNAKVAKDVQTSKIKRLDVLLGQEVQQIARKLKVLVSGKTSDPLYLSVFPVTPTVGLKTVGGEEQTRFIRNIIDQIEAQEELAELRSDLPELKRRQEELLAALNLREEQRYQEQQAKNARDRVIARCCEFYNQLYGQVLTIFHSDRNLTDSFFMSFAKKKKSTESKSSSEED